MIKNCALSDVPLASRVIDMNGLIEKHLCANFPMLLFYVIHLFFSIFSQNFSSSTASGMKRSAFRTAIFA